jgi:hypothetical protein
MSFQEDFSRLMAEQGIPVEIDNVPDPDTVRTSLDTLDSWFWSLDPAVREGFDEGSAEYAVCYLLGTDLNIAPELAGVLSAFDQSSGMSFSQLATTARSCLEASGIDNV